MASHQKISDEDICSVLQEIAEGKKITAGEQHMLEQWMHQSTYNKSVYNEILSDTKLRSTLTGPDGRDHSQFWKIVITHRVALHEAMPYSRRNFWQRMTFNIAGMFKNKKPRG